MIPLRIKVENFLSFGPETTFEFAEDEPLWVLSGPNGVGKSTVFDAITYSLFGCHRGGKQDHEELIHHGANSFSIDFEFSYDGTRYRVTRSRGKKKRSVQTASRWEANEWVSLDIDEKASGLTDWVEALIGLDYTAFTSSVLLKQGEADAFIRAKQGPRMDLLKKIVHLEPYEALSARVHDATNDCKNTWKLVKDRLGSLSPVSAEELTAAEQAVQAKAEQKQKLQIDQQQWTELISHSKNLADYTREQKQLQTRLSEVAERSSKAESIRADYHALEELQRVVPTLKQLETLPGKLADAEEAFKRSQEQAADHHKQYELLAQELSTLESQIDAVEQCKTITAQHADQLDDKMKKFNTQHQQVKTLAEERSKLTGFAPDLLSQLQSATNNVERIRNEYDEANKLCGIAEAQLKALQKNLTDFRKVEVGINCSRCGQLVSKEHAQKEIAELEKQVTQVKTEWQQQQQIRQAHHDALSVAQSKQLQWNKLHDEKESIERLCQNLEEILHKLKITASLEELENHLGQLRAELPIAKSEAHLAEKAFATHQCKVKATRISCTKASEVSQASARQRFHDEKACDAIRFQLATYLDSLPEAWKLLWPLDASVIQSYVQKLNILTKSNIKDQYDALSADTELARNCQSRLQVLEQQMQQLPKEAHRPALELQKQLEDCKQLYNNIDHEHLLADRQLERLREQQSQYAKYSTQAAAAEKELMLYQKLDELLGKDGLQRDLVRSAERDLAESASQTLKNLTNGELTLELNTCNDKDAAFDLVVRQQNNSHEIGVNYLSGSQKFRVSVAIALAIGKYASGRNRPLESVIIDEGFGSLDRDGLAAMADELIALQKNAALKRIILVSHQEDFVDRFTAGYALTPGEQGTTAILWRR